MQKRTVLGIIILFFCFTTALGGMPHALAAGETLKVLSVNTAGCNSGQFNLTIERANLDGGTYTVHTVVTAGGLIYMNEAASISVNGSSGWTVFNNFSYGVVGNPGTYPIPAGQQMQLELTLERPIGTILYSWKLVVDGCDTGNIISNGSLGSLAEPGCDMTIYIPPTAVGATILSDTIVYWAPGQASDEVFPAGLTLRALGVDSTGQYTKVIFVCGYYWVPTNVIGPNYDNVWHGVPLPAEIVQ
jgi:hypothetical protein